MADGTLRPSRRGTNRDLPVEVDDNDVEMLPQGTLRTLRVKAQHRLDATPGFYNELEVNGENLPIVDVTVDPKRGLSAIVTVR